MSRRSARRRLLAAALLCTALTACKKPYRIGDYVWVEWEGANYPAYIIERKGADHYRVHMDGYDSRYDQDVTLDRIMGRIDGPVVAPPPPEKVARALGINSKDAGAAVVSPFKAGDRVRVKWRGSVYPATIVGVLKSDQYLVHYDGHETAWDEAVGSDRIVGRR